MTNIIVRDYHKAGHTFDKKSLPKTAEEAIEQSGLNWEVNKLPIYLKDGTQVPRNFAMQRSDNGDFFGTVGKNYTTLQNKQAFAFFDTLVADGVASYEAAGATQHGSRVWVRASLNESVEIGDKDKIGKYVVLSNTHDGTGAVHVFVTPYRFICSNALSAMVVGAKRNGEIYSIRHTAALNAKAKEALKTLESVNNTYKSLEVSWKMMAEFIMPPVKIDQYFEKLFPNTEDKKNRGKQIREEVRHYLATGRGSELGIDKTLWGSYNAVTEFLSHNMNARKGQTEDKHFDSLMFGTRSKKNEEAMKLALEMMGT